MKPRTIKNFDTADGGATMYIRKLVSSLLITLVLCGLFALLPAQILALSHCGCGNCAMAVTGRCTCSIWPYWCLADDDPSQFRPSTDTYPAEAISTVAGLNLISTELDVTKTVMRLVSGGECLHRKFTLNLLHNASDTLKFVPAHFEGKI